MASKTEFGFNLNNAERLPVLKKNQQQEKRLEGKFFRGSLDFFGLTRFYQEGEQDLVRERGREGAII
jgi:hypothetical protein